MLEGYKESSAAKPFLDELAKTTSDYLRMQLEQLSKIANLQKLYDFDNPRTFAKQYPGNAKMAALCESLHQFDLNLRGPLTIICHSLTSLAQQFRQMDPELLANLLNNPIKVAVTTQERLMLEYLETNNKAAELHSALTNYALELIELERLLQTTAPTNIEASQSSSPTVAIEDPDFAEDAAALMAKLTLSKPLPTPKPGLLATVSQYRTKSKSQREKKIDSGKLELSGSWDSGAWDSSKWDSLKKEAEDVTPQVTTTSQTDESFRKLKDKSKSFAPLYDLSTSEKITQTEITSHSVPKKRLVKSRSFS
jgi:hypothetical protein